MATVPARLTAVALRVPVERRRALWPFAAFGVFLLAMLVAGRAIDVSRHVEIAQGWTSALGILAPGAYVVLYVAATLIGVPGMPFTLLSPLLFGVVPAFVTMVVASGVSAGAAFLIARYVARDAFAERLADTEGFARLTGMVEAHDWVVIPVLRILPIAPFAIVNYGFGLTGVSFWRYILWSEAAMVPMNALLVLGADVFYNAATRGTVAWPLIGGVAVSALLVAGLAALGLRTLRS
jgi:uncharacterized membrane protein YdjX (TVP38/TMEM64 family)